MDLVVRLLGESASYTATMARAEADTNQYDQRLESLTTTMQRQQVASQLSTREAQVLALADKGASVAAAEYALSVARELDSLDALTAAEAEAARQKQVTALASKVATDQRDASAMKQVQALQQEKVGLTEGATAARIYAIEQSNLTSRQKDSLISLTLRNAALTQAAAAEKAAAQATKDNHEWVLKTIQSGHEAARATQASTIYIRLKEAALRGANEQQIAEIYTSYTVEQRNNQLSAAYQRRTAAIQQATAAQNNHNAAGSRGFMVISALSVGVQDAASVYGNMGLAGAINASANNLIFAASLMGPQAAIIAALGATVLQLGMAWYKTAGQAKDGAARMREAMLSLDIEKLAKDRLDIMSRGDDFGNADTALAAQKLAEAQFGKISDLDREIDIRRRAALDGVRAFERLKDNAAFHPSKDASEAAKKQGELVIQQQEKVKELQAQRNQLASELTRIEQRRQALTLEENGKRDRALVIERDIADTAQRRAKEEAEYAEQQAFRLAQEEEFAAAQKFAFDQRMQQIGTLKELEIQLWKETHSDEQVQAYDRQTKAAENLKNRLTQINEMVISGVLDRDKAALLKTQAQAAFEQQSKAEDASSTGKRGRRDQAPDLHAVETNSQAGFKAIFEATNGGQGPTEALLGETKKGNIIQGNLVRLFGDFMEDQKKKGVVKVK